MFVQKVAKIIGASGCYLACVLRQFQSEAEILRKYEEYLKAGWIKDDCTMLRPDLIAQDISRKKWSVRFEGPKYTCREDEWEVDEWKWGKLRHFCLPNWDPLEDSNTRTNGEIVAKRVFKRIG